MKHPQEEKYCKLRLANANIKKNVADIAQARFLLEMMGFEEILMIPEGKPGQPMQTQPEPYLVLLREGADPRDMQHLSSIMSDIVSKNNMTPLTSKIQLTPQQRQTLEESKKPAMNSIQAGTSAPRMKAALNRGPKAAQERLRDAAAQRINRQIN